MADGDSNSEADGDDIVDVIGGDCYNLSERDLSPSSPLATRGQHWTNEEQNLFIIGLEQCGNKWSQIAKLIGSRTTAQVKSHAKHYFKTLVRKAASSDEVTPAVQIMQTTEEDLVDVDDPLAGCGVVGNALTIHEVESPASEVEESRLDALAGSLDKDESCVDDEMVDIHSLAAGNVGNSLEICREVITEDEKKEHPEFFKGGSKKTPSRYLAIRNHILGIWEKKRPHYVTKLAARNGLTRCGDVNCVGKIHTYLERTGAINSDCENRRRGRPYKRKAMKEPFVSQRMQLRERKVPTVIEDVTNSGCTIEHDEEGNVVRQTFITAAPTVVQRSPNPFKLVPCCPYSADDPQPFDVSVDLISVLVMDAHAHCLKTEVMGLLGGRFYPGRVCVQSAVPCESLSTGIECEMDPVSQAMAGERIHSQDQQVVGWYHSHPTFAPTPSRRDLETQSAFRDHFWPFVGAIISPFGHASATASEVCFWLMDGNIPRQLNVHHGDCQGTLDQEMLTELCRRVRLHPDRISLKEHYFQKYTYLEKMLVSLRHHTVSAGATEQATEKILFQVRTVFDDS